jgi:YHS domain-containing protein
MRWVLLLVALCLVGCARKDRSEGGEKSPSGATTLASGGGVCGPESTVTPAETSCGETTGHDCNASCGCEEGDQKKANAPILPVSEAKPGDRTRCLVTNTVFKVTTDSPSVEHDGKKYFFCCDGCADKFKAAPAKFLGS